MGTSFSFAVLLRDFSCWARSSDSNGSLQHSNCCRCSPYTIFALISAFPLLRLYRSLMKRLVREGILGMDFYSLFSLLYYTILNIKFQQVLSYRAKVKSSKTMENYCCNHSRVRVELIQQVDSNHFAQVSQQPTLL